MLAFVGTDNQQNLAPTHCTRQRAEKAAVSKLERAHSARNPTANNKNEKPTTPTIDSAVAFSHFLFFTKQMRVAHPSPIIHICNGALPPNALLGLPPFRSRFLDGNRHILL
jgi:hypothetical protein